MEFNRHNNAHQCHSHHGYNFTSRQHNNAGSSSSYGGYHQPAPGGFVSHQHSHPPHGHNHIHGSRSFKFNSGHGLNGSRLNLMHSYRNLMKLQSEVATERNQGFLKLRQLRDLMLTRISTIAGTILNDEFLDGIIAEITQAITPEEGKLVNEADTIVDAFERVSTSEESDISEGNTIVPQLTAGGIEDIKYRWRNHLQNAVKGIVEETEVYAMKEDNFLGAMFAKTKRVEQDFGEFFNEAERQITDHEKKSRDYLQIVSRLRTTERELAIRNEKIMQLEDTLKIVGDRSEKFLAELQQVNSDSKFEKLQLQHHAEATKLYAKYIALAVLVKTCQWKRCSCGRQYDDILRDFEMNLNSAVAGDTKDYFPVESFQKIPDRQQMAWAWYLPPNSNVTPYNQPIPVGGFAPTEDAETNGPVFNDLRDRYDELQFKGVPNCDEIRTMMLKITCHFKAGDYRVCEEMQGKQFVSSLFFCNTEDLVPSKTGKVFSTGFGDTPEEATQRSVQQAVNEINRIENMNTAAEGLPITYISKNRNPADNSVGTREKGLIPMTLLRSYCGEKDDEGERELKEETSVGVSCLQEAYLYQNHVNATEEKYMVDWQIHLRVEDALESVLKEKLNRILCTIKDTHMRNFLDNRPRKEITNETNVV